jgi:hypothetical protein
VSAKDKFHDIVKNALIKDDWLITDDPLFLKVGGLEFFVDLGAEKLLSAERNGQRIAVEVKSFVGASSVTDFHLAIGQFINYRTALRLKESDRKLFLAIPENIYESFFQKELPQVIIKEYGLDILIYNIESEAIVRWIP